MMAVTIWISYVINIVSYEWCCQITACYTKETLAAWIQQCFDFDILITWFSESWGNIWKVHKYRFVLYTPQNQIFMNSGEKILRKYFAKKETFWLKFTSLLPILEFFFHVFLEVTLCICHANIFRKINCNSWNRFQDVPTFIIFYWNSVSLWS